jgi:hypothetical protein
MASLYLLTEGKWGGKSEFFGLKKGSLKPIQIECKLFQAPKKEKKLQALFHPKYIK